MTDSTKAEPLWPAGMTLGRPEVIVRGHQVGAGAYERLGVSILSDEHVEAQALGATPAEAQARARAVAEGIPAAVEALGGSQRRRRAAMRLLDGYRSHVHNASPDNKPDGLRAVADCMEIVRGALDDGEESVRRALALLEGKP